MLGIYNKLSRSAGVLALFSLLVVSACGDGTKSPKLESLALTPSAASIAAGTEQQFTGVATLSDGTTEEIPAGATWASSDTSVATVDQNGLAIGVSPGSSTISLSAAEISITATLTVTDALLLSIDVTPTNPSVAAGTEQAFEATGTFSDMTTQDLTSQVTWSSSNTGVATVSSTGLATSSSAGSTDITASKGEVSGSSTLTVTAATLVSISVEPAAPSIASGTTQQFSAIGVFSDSSTQDLTTTVTWASSDTGVATIDDLGLASGLTVGSSDISATSGAISGTATLTVTAAELVSLAITPANPTIADGTAQQFTATGTFTDSSVQDLTDGVTWASSNTGIATISNAAASEGLATATLPGTTQITATSGSIVASTNLNVSSATLESIAVTPIDTSTPLGINRQFTATGTFSDNSVQDVTASVTWTSSNTGVAQVSNGFGTRGLATPVAIGDTVITAIDPNNATTFGSADLSVTAAVLQSIAVNPGTASTAAGTNQSFTATGTFSDNTTADLTTTATWSSSNIATATIGVNTGVATGNVIGTVTITATSGAISGTATFSVTAATLVSLDVTPTNPSVALGIDQQFTATGLFTDSSTQDLTEAVTWSSSATAVATVSNTTGNRGFATSETVGNATITATHVASGINNSTTFTVTGAVLQSINVTGLTSIPSGTATQLTATGIFTDGTNQNITGTATWTDGDGASIVSVSNGPDRGRASAVSVGTSSVTATQGGVSSTPVAFTVTAETLQSITVAPANPSIARGTQRQFTATGNYSGGSSINITTFVTWSTSGPAATVSNAAGSRGLATGANEGTANVIATQGVISGSTILTVTAAELVEIVVAPAVQSIPLGNTQQFTATGIFTDSSTQDVTTSVTWLSLTPGVATVSNAVESEGLATSVAVGSSEIVATDVDTGLSASSVLSVNDAALVSIDVEPLDPSVAATNAPQQFTATGTFTDNSTDDITTQVTWTSSDTTIATIDAGTGVASINLVGNIGNTTITATSGAITGTSILTVTAATLQSIEVTSANDSVALGSDEPFTATGVFSDLSTQDLTGSATWSCVDVTGTNVATISAAGLASADNVGSCTATAVFNAVTGTRDLEVTDAELVSIAISPTASTRALGLQQTFTASGTFTDDTVQNPLTGVTWTSSDTAVASIDPTSGVATTLSVGQTTITATRDGISNTASLTVSDATLVTIAVTSDDDDASIADGTTSQLTATGTFTDGSQVDLTTDVSWSCPVQGPAVLSISNAQGTEGFATAIDPGQCDATATLDEVQGALAYTVTNATLVSIVIDNEPLSTPLGRSLQLSATATFTDASTQDFTTQVNWSSDNGAIAFVLNGQGNQGRAAPVAVGNVTVTATVIANNAISDTANLEVREAELVSFAISPAEPSLNVNQVIPLTVQGTYTDGSTQNHTGLAGTDWVSSNDTVASVGNDTGNKGVTVGIANGFALISATDFETGITDEVCVTVGTGVCPTFLAGDDLIAIDSGFAAAGNPNMYSIDTDTGVATLIGSVDGIFSAIAFDPNGVLWGIQRRDTEFPGGGSGIDTIHTIDAAGNLSAGVTYVGESGGGSIANDITITSNGDVYGTHPRDSQMTEIDVVTGVSAAVFAAGSACNNGAIAANQNTLFFVNDCVEGPPELASFNTTSETRTVIDSDFDTGLGPVKAMTFVDNTLFAIVGGGQGGFNGTSLVSINTTSGAVTLIGSEDGMPGSLDGLAFFNPVVVTPPAPQ